MQIIEAENSENEVFVDVYVFLYEGINKLCTIRSKHFIQCVYKQSGFDDGAWSYIGWQEDEWGGIQ